MSSVADVARLARVSKSTASRALRGHPAISPDTVARVRAAAAQLNYVPNRAAMNLAKRRSQTIVLFVNNLLTRQTEEFHDGVESVCVREGYLMSMQKLGEDKARSERYIRLLREMRVEGVIVVPHVSGVHREEILLMKSWGIPVVQIDNYVAGTDTDYVGCDNRFGGMVVAEHLAGMGYQNFAVVSAVPRHLSCIAERIEAFHETIRQLGFSPAYEMIAEPSTREPYEFSRRAMHTLLDILPMPLGVFATSAPTSIGVLRAIRERGLRCPQDVGVAAFDDEQCSAYLETSLTAVHWPAYEIAQQAAELLLQRVAVKGTAAPPQHLLRKPVLVPRESTLGFRIVRAVSNTDSIL